MHFEDQQLGIEHGSKKSEGAENQEKGAEKVPLSQPHLDHDDIRAVQEVLGSKTLSLGPKLHGFERRFAEITETSYAVGVNSGTSGLHLCIRALGIQDGDEVITTPFSFVSSANCILYERAKPVFVDVEEDTFNMDPEKIEAVITPKTKAILVVHIFGQSSNMARIMDLARKHHLQVIEDACESIEATHHGKKTGTFGAAGVFAFYPNKQMTTGEGGMIVTNREDIYAYCKSAANQGRSDDMQWLLHDKLGFNYRLDEMSAALGLSQLQKLPYLIQERQNISQWYLSHLQNIKGITLPTVRPENTSTWFVFPIRVRADSRDHVIEELQKRGIQSKAYFFPCIHLQPFYRKLFGYHEGLFPMAEKLSRETLILPFFPGITEQQLLKVNESLQEIMRSI